MTPPRKILILEPKWTGHYPMFAALLATALEETGASVTLSLTRCGPEETGGIPELAEAEVAGRLEVRRDLAAIPSGFSPLTEGGGAHELSVIGDRIRRTDADVVLIPSADSVACARETRPTIRSIDTPVAGCIHNARFGYPARNLRFILRREWMRRRLRRCGMTLGTLDPIAAETGRSIPLQLLPMPVAKRGSPAVLPPLIRELEERLAGRRMVLAIGEHSRRKATDRIVACWPDPAPEDAVLVVAGRRDPQVDEAIGSRRADVEAGRIIDIDGVRSTAEFDALLSRADVVVSVYRGHVGISGVAVEAAALGTTVLGSAEGGIGRLITDHGLGSTVSSEDEGDLAAALAAISSADPPIDAMKRDAFIGSCRGEGLGRAWGGLFAAPPGS